MVDWWIMIYSYHVDRSFYEGYHVGRSFYEGYLKIIIWHGPSVSWYYYIRLSRFDKVQNNSMMSKITGKCTILQHCFTLLQKGSWVIQPILCQLTTLQRLYFYFFKSLSVRKIFRTWKFVSRLLMSSGFVLAHRFPPPLLNWWPWHKRKNFNWGTENLNSIQLKTYLDHF